MFLLLFIGLLALTIEIKLIRSEWTGTVYIKADGSINPPDADVNCDGKVDIFDIILATSIYDSREDELNWNPNVNYAPPWNRIDIYDLVTIASYYGQQYSE